MKSFIRPSIALLAAVAHLCLFGGLSHGQVVLDIAEVNAAAGGVISIPVTIDPNGLDVSAVSLGVAFDTLAFDFNGVLPGDAVPAGASVEGNEQPPGTLVLLAFTGDNVTTFSAGVLFVIQLRVIDAETDESFPIEAIPDESQAADPQGGKLALTLMDGAVNLICQQPPAPANVEASEGRTDGVLITWDAVEGVTEYNVFRNTVNELASAVEVSGWIAVNSFLDESAPGPSSGGFGCPPGGGVVELFYWVKSRRFEDCESGFSAPATGSRAAGTKSVYAKSAPVAAPGETNPTAAYGAELAVRLRHEDGVDTQSLWASATDGQFTSNRFYWLPLTPESITDGWIVFSDDRWAPGADVAVSAGGTTLDGEPVEPVHVSFHIVERDAKSFSSDSASAQLEPLDESVAPAFAAGVGGVYRILPEFAYGAYRELWVPVPQGHSPDRLTLFYYHEDGLTPQWRPGNDVASWIDGEPELFEEPNGLRWLRYSIGHGGVVQLGYDLDGAGANEAAALPIPSIDFWLVLLALCVVALYRPLRNAVERSR